VLDQWLVVDCDEAAEFANYTLLNKVKIFPVPSDALSPVTFVT
jgi:hypothetical protein